jgi:thiol-disulfide isomerase/thioredoxin
MDCRTVLLTAALGGVFWTAAEEPAKTQVCDASGVCTAAPAAKPAAGKQMWAVSRAFTDAPPLEVGKWLSEKPETDGKYVVIEFWRTWCGACKRMTPLMNALQKKFGDELVVIGITGESEEKVKAYNGPRKEYTLAIDRPLPKEEQTAVTPDPSKVKAPEEGGPDTANAEPQAVTLHPDQGRYESYFGVWGWPHVVILEPQYRTVVWEGFSGLEGYALTEEKVAKILAIGRKKK